MNDTEGNENSKRERKIAKNPAKRTAILKAAGKTFAQKGFHEATIADIAKKARVSEATIYDYFNTKEELLFSLPAEIIQEYQKDNKIILEYVRGSANRLRVLIYRHLKLYEENPEYANVAMLILKTNRNFLKTDAYKVIQNAARSTLDVLKEGMENGEFRADINPYLVRAMIWGTIEHLVIRRSLLGKPHDLLSMADELVDTMFQGILTEPTEPELRVRVTVEHKESV